MFRGCTSFLETIACLIMLSERHSLITPFDLGICFQRKSGVMFGEMYYDTAEYLNMLKKRYAIIFSYDATSIQHRHTFVFTKLIFSIGFGDSLEGFSTQNEESI